MNYYSLASCDSPFQILRQRREKMRLANFAVTGALAVLGMASQASAEPNAYSLSADETDRISTVCQSVIGLRPGEKHFSNCVASLSSSVKDLDQGRALVRARDNCLSRGLPPGDARLAECTLQTDNVKAVSTSRRGPLSSDVAMSVPGGAQSYFTASNGDVHRREQLACARLGFDPTGRAFGSCVANLQASLFAADHPMN